MSDLKEGFREWRKHRRSGPIEHTYCCTCNAKVWDTDKTCFRCGTVNNAYVEPKKPVPKSEAAHK